MSELRKYLNRLAVGNFLHFIAIWYAFSLPWAEEHDLIESKIVGFSGVLILFTIDMYFNIHFFLAVRNNIDRKIVFLVFVGIFILFSSLARFIISADQSNIINSITIGDRETRELIILLGSISSVFFGISLLIVNQKILKHRVFTLIGYLNIGAFVLLMEDPHSELGEFYMMIKVTLPLISAMAFLTFIE